LLGLLIAMKKTYFLLLFLVILQTRLFASPNLFSKIVITSKKAVCSKNVNQESMFTFTYSDDVKVTFADGSVITSSQLQVDFQGSAKETKKVGLSKPATQFNSFKKITFNNNVSIIHAMQKATAQKAELFLVEKLCKLSGNVVISQKKEKQKDIPVTIESNAATFNLETSEVTFAGTSQKPVSTVIILEGHPSLQKKIKPKKNYGKNPDSVTQSST